MFGLVASVALLGYTTAASADMPARAPVMSLAAVQGADSGADASAEAEGGGFSSVAPALAAGLLVVAGVVIAVSGNDNNDNDNPASP
jgi:hypothetical protein